MQTTLLDDGFHFVDMLLGRGRDTSSPVNMLSPTPLGFAPSQLSGGYTSGQSFPEDAFAYATKAPTAKAPSMADVGNGWSAWLAGSGTSAKFDSTANNFGFGYRSAGASGGMERRVGNWLYGGAFSISRSNVNQDATGDSAGIDTQRLGIYGAYQPAPFTVAAAMSYGHHSTDASRLTMLPGLDAQAGYQANSLNAGVDVSKTYAWQWGNVQPMAGLIYNGLWTNGFVEGGNSLLGINSSNSEIAALKGYVGGRAYRTFVTTNGMEVTPELRARAVYDFLNDQRGCNPTVPLPSSAPASRCSSPRAGVAS